MTDHVRRHRGQAPWIVALAGAIASLVLWRALIESEVRAIRARFERDAVEASLAVEHGLADALSSIETVTAVLASAPEVTEAQFRAVARLILRQQPAIRALSWNPRVRAAERANHEAIGQAATAGYRITERGPDGALAPARPRDEHYVVRFIEPLSGNEPALGFDVGSEPRRRAALVEALENDRLTLTADIDLVQEASRKGILAFCPLYRDGAPHETLEQRQRHLAGFVVGVFVFPDLVDTAMRRSAPDDLRVSISDASGSESDSFLLGAEAPDPASSAVIEHVTVLEQGGRIWKLHFTASPWSLSEHAWVPLLGLLAGLAVTAFASAYLGLMLARTRRIEEIASARARSEARLRLILDAASDGGWDLNLDTGAVSFSDSWLRSLGYTREEIEPSLHFARSLVHPEDRPGLDRLIRTHLAGKTPRYESLNRVRAGDGAYRWIASRGAVVERDPDGRPLRMVGADTDVTERHKAELEHRRLQVKLQEAQKLESLGILAGGIAHDFNNLLTGVLGNAELALTEVAPESPGREELEQIQLAATRAAELTRQLLTYSGRSRFESRTLDLSRLTAEMLHLLEASISKKAKLRHELAPELPALRGDPTQIRQVVMNLITNASDALGGRPGVIRIRTGVGRLASRDLTYDHLDPAAERQVFVEVSDSGCGMDAETRARMFDPFFTTKFHGRGLGLAAALGIVRSHHGAVRVESAPGRGTTITVLFPPASQSVEKEAHALAVVDDEWRGRGTVLVVDDEPAVRRLASRLLERIGFTVCTATDGAEGVEMFQKHTDEIVAVLLDLTMPRMGGVEVFRAIRSLRPGVPILFSSGYDAEASLDQLDGRPDGFVAKPYTARAFTQALRAALG